MENINLNNYQSYFLDFAEGNLSATASERLAAFLKNNPDLKKELDEFDLIELKDQELTENKKLKQELIRNEDTGLKISDYLMIAETEGLISLDEKKALSLLIKEEPQLLDKLAIYHKVKLVQNNGVKFEDKESLKQKEKRSLLWLPFSAAAAIALIIVFNNGLIQKEYSPKKLSIVSYENSNSTDLIKSNYNKENTKKNPIVIKGQSQSLAKLSSNTTPKNQIAEGSSITPMKILSFQKLKSRKVTKEPKYFIEEQFAKTAVEKNTSSTEDFQPIDQFAINAIKSKLLDNKSVRDALLNEIASLSNDKISYQEELNSNNSARRFSINIGKFGYSNF